MKLHEFQMVIDRYPMQVEVKGAYVDLSATRYVFTSNKHPSDWYSAEADPDGTVMRRITEFCERFDDSFTVFNKLTQFPTPG